MDTKISFNRTGDLIINGITEMPRIRDVFSKDNIEFYIQLSRFQVIKLIEVLKSRYKLDQHSDVSKFLEKCFFYNGSCKGFISLLDAEQISYDYQNWLS